MSAPPETAPAAAASRRAAGGSRRAGRPRPGIGPGRDGTTPERILQRLDWQVIRRLDGILQGDYRTLFRGNGVDLAGIREYQPGDDVRYIDWNVTARMDEAYVREYNEDREITAWFLLDLSPSVDFGTAATDRVKRSVLVDFVGTLSRLLTRRGNRVGALLHADELRQVPARSGRDQVLRIIDTLLAEPSAGGTSLTDLDPVLSRAARVIRRRSLVFVISDFIAVPGWERGLSLLNRRHEVVAVRLYDRREVELPDAGPVILQDSETGEQLYVDTRDRRFRRRFEEAARAREAAIGAAFRRAGVSALALSTDEDLVRAIVRMATERRARR